MIAGPKSVEVSIIIPTHDRNGVLPLTVASALRQQHVELEIIVVDDGSTEETARTLAEIVDRRLQILRQEGPGGVSAARNRGIREANGAWVAFLDDDDVWAPNKLASQLKAATDTGRVWAYGGDVNVDADLRVLTGSPPPTPEQVMAALPRYNPLSTGGSNVVVRADVLTQVGGFDPTLRRTEDWDMWIRLSEVGPPAAVARPLVAYRFHAANVATETSAMVQEPDLLARRYGIPVDRAAMQRRAAWASLRAGRRARAVRHYARAVSMGDLRSAGRALMAATHPAVGSDRIFRLLRNRPEDDRWRREAEAWLNELRGMGLQGSTT
jgi:glycosyltransferase involved in cell wall biosynthesis